MHIIWQNIEAKTAAVIGRMRDLPSKEEMPKKNKSMEVGYTYVGHKCDKFCHDNGSQTYAQ